MPKKAWGETISQILSALKEYGPMTRSEIEHHIGLNKRDVGGQVSRLCKENAQGGQRIHICGYTRDQEGERRYIRAVYAYGPGKNKPKPNDQKKERVKYTQMQTNRVRNAFVFNLGLRRDDVRQMKKDVRSSKVHMGQGS